MNAPAAVMATLRLPNLLLAAAMLSGAAAPAWSDSGRSMPRAVPPAYTQECGSCHLAYPPGLLPALSWQRLMGGLDRHFGTDAIVIALIAALKT